MLSKLRSGVYHREPDYRAWTLGREEEDKPSCAGMAFQLRGDRG